MMCWRGRRCPAAVSSALRVAGVGLVAVAVLAVPGMAAAEGHIGDPRDVGKRLDLKTLTHAQDGGSIVYTAGTYAPFSDQSAAFKWGLDRDGDEDFDLLVFAEWRDGKLVGGVEEPAGRQIAPASVSRPGPTAIRVSFPAGALDGAAVYRYAVDAEAAPGERDIAPNSGLVQHRLGAVAAPGAEPARAASSSAAVTPADRPSSASGAASAPAPRPATQAAPKTGLPTTGPGGRGLLPWAGLAFMAGGALVGLGAQRGRVRRLDVKGGMR